MNLPYAQQTTMLKFGSCTKAPNFSINLSFFTPSNPNQQDYTREDAKSLVFLLCSYEIMVFFWIVFETHHQPFTKLHSHKTFIQTLIVSSYPQRVFLTSWEIMLAYVSLVGW
jgi:hypothetical protein